MPIFNRLRNAWNAFTNNFFDNQNVDYSAGSSSFGTISPSRPHRRVYNERSIVGSIYTRLSTDVSGLPIKHVKVDDQNRYLKDMESGLNDCLVFEPNIDQSPRAFRQDIAMTLFDKGVAALVPVDTTVDPRLNQSFDVLSMRVGEVVAWYPKHVRVSVYNEEKGLREEIVLQKRFVSIIENPFLSVMNEPNSTLQRLIRKLNLLDVSDERLNSGRLDIIIQLPYVVKSEAKKQQAATRIEDIEFQLRTSQHGIAYVDGTEKITQLNRPAENDLLKQIEWLTNHLYTQLGLTPEIMNGTAKEEEMVNYYNRTIEPITDAIVQAMQRAFLGPQGTQNKERIQYFRDPFKLVPVSQIAEIADKFTRNEILSSNEIRSFMGIVPSPDPKADKLNNSNMPSFDRRAVPPLAAIPQPQPQPMNGNKPQNVSSGA